MAVAWSISSWSSAETSTSSSDARDREVGADALPLHARLAGGDVVALRRRDDQLPVEVRADVLDLADDPQAVLAQQVELGDVRAGVGDVEMQGASGGLLGREVARVVGRGDRDRARVALLRVGVLGAAGEHGHGEQQGCGEAEAEQCHGSSIVLVGTGQLVRSWGPEAVGWGVAAADRPQEQEHDGDDVEQPGRGLEPGGGRAEVEDALEQGGVPAAGLDRVGDVEREVVQAGQDARLLEVVDAVRQDAAGDQDQERAGPGEELAEVDPDRAAVEQVAEHDGGEDPERGAEQRLPGRCHGTDGLPGGDPGRGPEEERGLQALTADREHGDHDQ